MGDRTEESRVKAILDLLEHQQAVHDEVDPTPSTYAEAFIKTSKPIGVVLSSDWHLGSLGVDYRTFQRDTDFLLAHADDLRLITVGDEADNFKTFKSLAPIFEQGISPKMQARLLENLASVIAKKKMWLAGCWGNHTDERDERLSGESLWAQLFRKYTIFFDGIGLLKLRVGLTKEKAQVYTILMTHNARGNSATDKTHGAKRLYREKFPADLVVSGHKHTPAYSVDTYYTEAQSAGFGFGGKRIMVATGTYLLRDLLGRRYYPCQGAIGTPTVMFWPDQRRTEVFSSAEDAVTFSRGLTADQGEKA